MGWYSTDVAPPPPTQASHPPAGRRASCLVEGGDGAADGWEDDRNDKKESLWEDKRSRGTGPGFQRPSGSGHPSYFAAVRFVIQSSPPNPPKTNQHVQSSAEREQGHPDQEGVDQRHNAATS